jgi:hypothetical protein
MTALKAPGLLWRSAASMTRPHMVCAKRVPASGSSPVQGAAIQYA